MEAVNSIPFSSFLSQVRQRAYLESRLLVEKYSQICSEDAVRSMLTVDCLLLSVVCRFVVLL